MRRREFITPLAGAAAWPLVTYAQTEQMRRIAVLMHTPPDDPDGQARFAAFLQGLQEAGWAVGRNVRVDTRWAAGDVDRFRSYASELLRLSPDVILASSSLSVFAFQQAGSTLPIVFTAVIDPGDQGSVCIIVPAGRQLTRF